MALSPSWTLPLIARRRLAIVAALGTATAITVFAAGLLAGRTSVPGRSVVLVPTAAPVVLNPPPSPAPVEQVSVPELVPPTPATEPVAEAPRPRALAPTLWPECFVPMTDPDAPDAGPGARCSWDTGFPAISSDGAQIARIEVPDDGGRGYPGLSIEFLDVRTSKVARTAVVLSPDEYESADPEDGDGLGAVTPRLRAKILRRAAAVQRALVARGFRSLELLGSHDEDLGDGDADGDDAPPAAAPVPTRIYAEIDGRAVRVIDPATAAVMWQHVFADPSPVASTDLCGSWTLRGMAVWWDPRTRTVLTTQSYRTGGCMCSDVDVAQVSAMR